MVRSPLSPIIIAGATGSGKSALAIKLAKKHRGEIICADSRQFYRFMRIGTASPSDDDLKSIPHHGFNTFDPRSKKIDAGFFVDFAKKTIAEIQERQQRPILVGGTGLYLRALRYGLDDVPMSKPELVKELEEECDKKGLLALYEELKNIDPESALFIKANDRYRIVRALEIYRQTKQIPSKIRQSFRKSIPKIRAHWILKNTPREALLHKLKTRVDAMFDEGLLEETKALRALVPAEHWSLHVMGYHEALLVLDNKLTLEEAKERVFIRHRQYAKQQNKWFKNESFYRWKIE